MANIDADIRRFDEALVELANACPMIRSHVDLARRILSGRASADDAGYRGLQPIDARCLSHGQASTLLAKLNAALVAIKAAERRDWQERKMADQGRQLRQEIADAGVLLLTSVVWPIVDTCPELRGRGA